MKKLVEKYFGHSKVKHKFYVRDRYSICGLGIVWYSPEQWKTDEVGLVARRLCKRCIKIEGILNEV